MIGVLAGYKFQYARDLVLAALRRSVSPSLAALIGPADLTMHDVALAISPDEQMGDALLRWLEVAPRKLIIFGHLPACFKARCGLTEGAWPANDGAWARSPAAASYHSAESPACVQYRPASAPLGAGDWSRAMERFDFTDEWNNLAFGAIRADGSLWALAEPLHAPAEAELAHIAYNGASIASYVALFNVGPSSVIWVNRPVGLIDSFEWRLLERYLAHWQHESLPCVPVISEIPWGYDAAITMRLDCDEDITSARSLWLAYQALDVPLSLAIHTNNLHQDTHNAFLNEFCQAGGALLSHTATHAPNWGGSYEAALAEARQSHDQILAVTNVSVAYAVSPFHQSPPYALQALCDAGYSGCIGGIIRNDPEFLLARGGALAGLPTGFVGHSQQTMLHGDCMRAAGDPLAIFKAAFDRAFETQTLFGYLDHPFSDRYAYGWADEGSRTKAHQDLIAYIRGQTRNPLFMSEVAALEFLRARTRIEFQHGASGFTITIPDTVGFSFGVEYRGSFKPLTKSVVLA